MTRTNIDIDDELVRIVMERYRLPTKRSAVDFALSELVIDAKSRPEVLAMRGTGFETTNEEIEGDWTVAS